MIGEQATVAKLGDGGRVDREHKLSDVARLRERMHPHVYPLQVQQHPHEDLRLGGVSQHVGIEHRVVTGVAPKQLAAGVLRQQSAAVERVDDEIFRVLKATAGRTAYQK